MAGRGYTPRPVLFVRPERASGAKQAAEKGSIGGKHPKGIPQGLKAPLIPCHSCRGKPPGLRPERVFSQPVKPPGHFLGILSARLEHFRNTRRLFKSIERWLFLEEKAT